MKKCIPQIQILRAILFILILAFHCGVPYTELGWAGVEIFFVISSFFVVRNNYDKMEIINVRKSFPHRVFRLYPPYIPVVIAAVLYVFIAKKVPYD